MHRLLAFHNNRMLDRQFLLADDSVYRVGRAADNDIVADWDEEVSRHHATLSCTSSGVRLRLLETASNAAFVDGHKVSDVKLRAGQSFVVGRTRFELQQVTQSDSPTGNTVQQLAIDRQQLKQLRYEDADKRIEVLTSLPAVIRESGVERDLYVRLANLLLAGIQHADGGWGPAPWRRKRHAYRPETSEQPPVASVEETALAVEALLAYTAATPQIAQSVAAGIDWLVERVETGRYIEPSPIGFYFAKLWYYERLYPQVFTVGALAKACCLAGIGPQAVTATA